MLIDIIATHGDTAGCVPVAMPHIRPIKGRRPGSARWKDVAEELNEGLAEPRIVTLCLI